MQPTPLRLQQAIWTAFQASKPVTRSIRQYSSFGRDTTCRRAAQLTQARPELSQWGRQPFRRQQMRFYVDDRKQDIEAKVEDARSRINDSLESKADAADAERTKLKQDETIVHTEPVSSSIVYAMPPPGGNESEVAQGTAQSSTESLKRDTESKDGTKRPTQETTSASSPTSSPFASFSSYYESLPSRANELQSTFRNRMSHFMDNFQSNIFVASRRINDLTGYSSIEQLKNDIEAQEKAVRSARQNVKDSRAAYTEAIDLRSNTQREVNDLLHRKNTWSSQDLERFTSLYRSDHANEQAEQTAHTNLQRAEAEYEDASQKLAKGILARYHEEQIWSDKIRQMSTWGTWGLMGLNVLLFIVFQILVEPWRRRRLVRGFEEKVVEALKERDEKDKEVAMAALGAVASQTAAIDRARVQPPSEVQISDGVADVVEQTMNEGDNIDTAAIAATALPDSAADTPPPPPSVPPQTAIEQAAESLTIAEIEQSEALASAAVIAEIATTDSPTSEPAPSPPPYQLPTSLSSFLATLHALSKQTQAEVAGYFDTQTGVIMTRRELSAAVLEGVVVGALGMAGLFWCAGVGR